MRLKTFAPDGHRWTVHHQRLLWRTRVPKWLHVGIELGELDAEAAMLFLAVALPILAYAIVSFTASLIVTPLVWLFRLAAGRPRRIPVVAYRRGARRATWTGSAPDAGSADHLVQATAIEIHQHGFPLSLQPPAGHSPHVSADPATPLMHPIRTNSQ